MHRFDIKNCLFSGKGKDATLMFLGGDAVIKPTAIYDTKIENMKVLARDMVRIFKVVNPENPNLSCTLDLVNCRFGETDASKPEGGAAVKISAKYYLDVKAPAGATVTVKNEVSEGLSVREHLPPAGIHCGQRRGVYT